MRKLYLFFFLTLSVGKVCAGTFFVTSKADAGAGSLREAITLANSNGTLLTDNIYFNLPGSTSADVTIILQSELPILTSNVVIDGTSQPFASLNHPNIKINITTSPSAYIHGLRLDNADHVAVYGLAFSNFNSDPAGATIDKKSAIYLFNSSFITIGAVNRSNCFMDNYAGILALPLTSQLNNSNLKISNNVFGTDVMGLTARPNEYGIAIAYMKDSEIGGSTIQEGNLISSNKINGISLITSAGDIKILNNNIGLNQTLTNSLPSLSATGIYISGNASIPVIANNIIGAQLTGMMLDKVNGGFIIATNRIGTGPIGTENFKNEVGIYVNVCNKGLIGGANLTAQNMIAYNETAVILDNAYPITLLKNSFYCNTESISFLNFSIGTVITQSRISTITANKLDGKFLPNSIVELFYTDACPGCEGKTWLATINTDASGFWIYNGVITGKVTSMGTNPDGATSTFSKPYIDDSEHVPARTLCGLKTGSITKMKVYDSNVYEWVDEDGVSFGNAIDVFNLPQGTYYLRAGQNGPCIILSTPIAILAAPIIIDDKSMKTVDASCSGTNGSITGIIVKDNLKRKWYEQDTDKFITGNDDLVNMPYGRYYFTVGEGACMIRSTTYLIANNAAFYELKEAKVNPVSCGASNGMITVIGYPSNATFTFKWFDEEGNVIGTTETLSNLAVGKYRLVAYSNFNCSTEVGVFNVDEAPLPTIDFTLMQNFLSCDGKTVSTTGITVEGTTGPFTYRWLDENNNLVSEQLNLTSIPIGIYKLAVVDNNSCLVESKLIDFTLINSATLNVPNSFTPNGDGINDVWQINGVQNYLTADFSIFSRDGNRVFYSRGYANPFDGIYNGKVLPIGVYYYVIDLKTECGKISGSLTILR